MKNTILSNKRMKSVIIVLIACVILVHFCSLTACAKENVSAIAESIVRSGDVSSSDKSGNGESIVDLANLVIQVCLLVIGFLTIVLAVITFLGFKSFRKIKKIQKEYKSALKDIKKEKEKLQEQIGNINEKMKNVVDVTYFHNEGEQAYREAEYEKAIRYFDDALKIQPDNDRIVIKKCRALVNLDRNEEVHQILDELLQKGENDEAWYTLATADRYINRKKALQEIDNAISIRPTSYLLWNYKGLLYRDAGELQSALDCHIKASNYRKEDAVSFFYRALIEYSFKRKEKARESIQKAKRFADNERHENTIKPIWADTIDYVYYHMYDKHEDADKIKEKMIKKKYSKRNQKAVLQHFLFCLKEDYCKIIDIRDKLKGFDEDVVNEILKDYTD